MPSRLWSGEKAPGRRCQGAAAGTQGISSSPGGVFATLRVMATDYETVEGQLLGKLTDGHAGQPAPAGPPPAVPDHELLRRIGSGSYGDVWLARNVVGTYRAVKVVYRRRFTSARPFEREFHGIQRYEPVSRRHEGLVDLLQIGRNDEAGFFYYVMELADDAAGGPPLAAPSEAMRRAISELAQRRPGPNSTTTESFASVAPSPAPEIRADTYRPRTLASEIRRAGRLPAADCVQVFLTLTAALSTLHRAGLLHRDIKPSNIIVVGGMAKLADIGLVAEAGAEMTFVGTEGFIPPEGPGTAGADLYALGKMFYEAFTGLDRLQFPSLPVGRDNLIDLKPLLELSAVANKACAAEPARRYQSAEEMLADLALLHSGRSVQRLRQTESRLRQARRFGLAAAAVAVVATGVGVFVETQRAREQRAREALALALADARLHRAVAERIAQQPGSRFAVLEAVTEVARSRPGDAELRGIAITALAQADVREVARQPPELKDPYAFAWNPAGDALAVAQTNGAIRVERPGHPPITVRGDFPLRPQTLDRSGRWLLAVDPEYDPQLWDTSAGRPIWLARDHGDAAALDPEGRWLFVVPVNGPAQLRDLMANTAMEIPGARISDGPAMLSNVGGGRVIVSQREGHTLRLVDLTVRQVLKTWDLPAGGMAFGLTLSPDGNWLRVGSADFRVFVFDAREPERPPVVNLRHQGVVLSGVFSPDGETCFSSGWDYSTRLMETATGREILQLPSWSHGMGFSPDGARFRRIDGATTFLHTYEYGATVCRVRSMPPAERGVASVGGVVFSSDGALMALPTWQGVRLYDGFRGDFLGLLHDGRPSLSAALSRDGSLTAATFDYLRRWSVRREGDTFTFAGPANGEARGVWMLAGTPHGNPLALGAGDGLYLGQPGRVPELLQAAKPGEPFNLVTMSPDGRWIAANHAGSLEVWETATRRMHWSRGSQWQSLPAFSADGRFLADSDRHAVRVLDVATRRVVWETPQPEGAGLHGAWSPDGRWLVFARRPDSLTAFDAETGAVWGEIRHPDARLITGVAFSPDGRQLVVPTAANVIHFWQLAELRAGLAKCGLDFPLPPLPPRPDPEPVRLVLPTTP